MSNYQWRQALEVLTPMARYHSGPSMAEAYRILINYYPEAKLFGYPAGDCCGTWEVPKGWQVSTGKLTGPNGNVIADYNEHLLSVYSYSPSYRGTVTLDELEEHLFSDPDRPDSILFHFRNQYRPWEKQWGFCIPHRIRDQLLEGKYEVEIDTQFLDSEMQMALQTHKGDSDESVLFIGHFDHPCQAGDGLIGCLAGHEALNRLKGCNTRLTYRMLSSVEIVGSVFYAGREARKHCVREAMFLAMSGVDAPLVYASSASECSNVDRIMAHLLKYANEEYSLDSFRGSVGNDEIAYDVYGVDIPCGSLMRWPYQHYHTDSDTAEQIHDEQFESYVQLLLRLIDVLENNAVLTGRLEGLPQLSHPDINLYLSPAGISGVAQTRDPVAEDLLGRLPDDTAREEARCAAPQLNRLMTMLPPLADGKHTVLDIAERVGIPFALVSAYTDMWQEKGLLEKHWINPFVQERNSQ